MIRKITLAVLVTLVTLNIASSAVLADGMILPETLSTEYLSVRTHHVTVDIVDQHAVTRVEQEFYNPHPFAVTGRYLFPIPPEAILSDFEVDVDGRPQTMTRQDAATTNATLFTHVAQRHDPSLLQYADWESLALDIEIPAGQSKRMVLHYEEVLAPTGGLYHYRYILSTERYSAHPLEEASVTVNVTSSGGLATLYASSHDVSTERLGAGQGRVVWSAENITPQEDFDLFFAPAEGGFGGGLLTGIRDGYGQFLFLFAPESASFEDSALPKDIVFVIDHSGSMSGEKIEQARDALTFILGQLNARDRFAIVSFDHRLSFSSEQLEPVERGTLREARRFVNALEAEGDTDLDAALQAGLNIIANSDARPEASRMVVFLTDGLPTAGLTDEVQIASRVAQTNEPINARLHVFGVGYDVNSHLLDRLADNNGGSVTYVQPGENLEHVLAEFYGRIANPVLTDVSVEFEGLTAQDLSPQKLPDMFQGSSLLLTGRYLDTDASDVTVRVRGQAGEHPKEYVYHFDVSENTQHDFVPRLWATRRVGQLLDQVRVEGETSARVEEIQALGLTYGVVTPYTTFIIAAQTEGAASADNMRLYEDQHSLNRASGSTTIQARVQNQSYQQAEQANLAQGSNVVNSGSHTLAQTLKQNVDLSLLQRYTNLTEPVTDEWITENVQVDRQVMFGTDAYFEMAHDPDLRPFLQSGSNVIFAYEDKVIQVQDPDAPMQGNNDTPPSPPDSQHSILTPRDLVIHGLSRLTGVQRFLADLYTWATWAIRN